MNDRSERTRRWAREARRQARAAASSRRRLDLDRLEPRTLLSGTPAGVDLGEFYYHFDQRLPLQRSADQFLLQIEADADRDAVLESLDGNALLDGFVIEPTTDARRFTVTRSEAVEGPVEPQYQALKALVTQVAALPGVEYATEAFVSAGGRERIQATNELYVALKPGVDPDAFFSASVFSGYRRVRGTTDQFIALATTDPGPATLALANQLQESAARVAWVTPNFYIIVEPMRLNDPLLDTQWHLENTGQNGGLVGADARVFGAWDLGVSGQGVVVAVLDDAVEWNHPDLIANAFVNEGEIPGNGIDDDGNGYVDDVHGWDFTDDDNDPLPVLSSDNHGTAVSGVAVGVGDNNLGVASPAYNAKLLPVRIPLGRPATLQQFSEPVYYASGRAANGISTWNAADVLNHSYGGGTPFPSIEAAFNWSSTAGRDGLGALNFAATGNGADIPNYQPTPNYPGAYASTIAIGGSTESDVRVTYSDYGAWTDLVAPTGGLGWNGLQNIQTTDRVGANGYAAGDYTGIGATGFNGTSSATPLAAGVGALIVEANPLLTAAQIRTLLRDTADKIGGVTYDSNGFHIEYGYGRINAAAAVEQALIHLTVGPSIPLVENQTYTNLAVGVLAFNQQTPPPIDSYTADVNFGDGTPTVAATLAPIGGNQFQVRAVGDKVFPEGGDFTMTVRVLFGGRPIVIGSADYTIDDIDLVGTGVDLNLAWQQAVFGGVVATFDDPDPDTLPADNYNASIVWGDGTTTPGVVLDRAGRNAFEVRGDHGYGGGTYPLSVTVRGPGGSILTTSATAEIEDAPFTAEAMPIQAVEGTTGTFDLARFVDLDIRTPPPSYYRALIDYGDGPYASTDVNKPIEDRPDRPLTSTLVLDKGEFTLGALKVNLNISHPRAQDLTATLTGPDGTTVTLFRKPVSNGGDFNNVTFDDDSDRTLGDETPYSGSYRPLEPLSAFIGKELTGTWTLTLTDDTAGFIGRLNSWSLSAYDNGEIIPEFDGSHTVRSDYAFSLVENRKVQIEIRDSDISRRTVYSEVDVTNLPLVTQPSRIQTSEGATFSGVLGRFQDPNPFSRAGDFTAEAVMPDGTVVPVQVTYDGGGRFFITGTLAFRLPAPTRPDGTAGTLPVIVRIRERGQAPTDPPVEFTVEAQVANPPISGQGSTFTATEGQALTDSNPIARFRDGNPLAVPGDYEVLVDWAGAIVQGGVQIEADPDGQPGDFVIVPTGSVLWPRAGQKNVRITLRDRGPTPDTFGQEVVFTSVGQVLDAPLKLTATDLGGVFTERTEPAEPVVVGRFTDTNASGVAAPMLAAVNWGDGTASAATIRSLGNGQYEILASHVYQDPGVYVAYVIVGSVDGASAAVPTIIPVADKIVPLTGGLDPASDLGSSSEDGITSVANPTFQGRIDQEPGALIRIFVIPSGGGVIPAGSGFADATGAWSIPIIPLENGTYRVIAIASDTLGRPSSEMINLTGPGGLVIDSTPARIASAVYDTRIAAFRITYADDHSGMDPATMLDPSLYRLTSPGRPRGYGAPVLSVDPADPNTVIARFATRGALGGQVTLTIHTQNIHDWAGNRVAESIFVDHQQPGSPFVGNYNLRASGPLIGATPFVASNDLFGADRFEQFLRARSLASRIRRG